MLSGWQPFVAAIRADRQCGGAGCDCARPAGKVHCVCHDDQHPSLEVSEQDGRVFVRCWAGCDQQAVIAALRARDLWPDRPQRRRSARSRPAQPGTGTGGGLTLDQLAQAKHLPASHLRFCGV
jgi:hypothetical protein